MHFLLLAQKKEILYGSRWIQLTSHYQCNSYTVYSLVFRSRLSNPAREYRSAHARQYLFWRIINLPQVWFSGFSKWHYRFFIKQKPRLHFPNLENVIRCYKFFHILSEPYISISQRGTQYVYAYMHVLTFKYTQFNFLYSFPNL